MILVAGFIREEQFHYYLSLDYRNTGVLKIFSLIAPLLVGMVFYRSLPIYDRYFLSLLPEGSISYIGYAQKIMSVITSILVSGISISIFPVMAKLSAEKNFESLRRIMSRGIRMMFFLSIPFVIIFAPFCKDVIALVLQRGVFTPQATWAVYLSFLVYSLALPASVIGNLIGQGYYVLQDTKTVTIMGIIEMAVYLLLCRLLINHVGYLAIPFAFAIYFNLSIIADGSIVRYKLGSIGGKTIIRSFFIHTAVAVVSALTAAAMSYLNIPALFAIAVSFLLYLAASRWVIKSDESKQLFTIITGYLQKYRPVK